MKIIKHGKLREEGNRINLSGTCEVCNCKFETYVDVIHKDEGDLFVTDPDCTDIKFHPTYDEPEWMPNTFVRSQKLIAMDYSIPCPECRRNVKLKVKE